MATSLSGWGATLHNFPVQGQWTQQEARLPINVLELRAISSPTFQCLHCSSPCPGAHRQHICKSLYQQSRGIEIIGTTEGRHAIAPVGRVSSDEHQSRAHQRVNQHSGRLAQQRTDATRGMVTQQGPVPTDTESPGTSHGGPIRFPQQ